MKDLSETTRARGEAGCRDAIPTLEKSLRTPQGSEASEDMPFCKRVAAAYCSPEVKNTYGGEAMCAQGRQNWYAHYLSASPQDRAAQNEKCASSLPAVIQAMKMHVQNFGPGTAASARAMGAQQGAAVPGAVTAPPRTPAPGGGAGP
jgi:hypothetical protein